MKKLIGSLLLVTIFVSCKKTETPIQPNTDSAKFKMDSIPRAFRVCKTSYDSTPAGVPSTTVCNYVLYVFANSSDTTYVVEVSADTTLNLSFTPLYPAKFKPVVPNMSPNIIEANYSINQSSGKLKYNKDTDSIYISENTRLYGAGASGYNMSGKSIYR